MSWLKIWFLALMLLLLVQSAYAASIDVEYTAIRDRIIPSDQAAFDVEITNNQGFEDTFRFTYFDDFWELGSDPLYHYFSGVTIGPGESKTIRLLANPFGELDYGQYRFDVTIKSVTGKNTEIIPLFIYVRPEHPTIGEYLAAVRRIVEIPYIVDPREELTVKVNLINRNPKNLTDLKVVLSSNLFNSEVSTSLAPLESKVIVQKFTLDSLTPPQKDVLSVILIVDGSELQPVINEPFEIGSYSDITATSSKIDKSFLKTVETTTYTNEGNIEGVKIVETETNFFKKLFTKSSPKAFEIRKGGKQLLAWEIVLDPSASTTVSRTVSYRPLLLLFLILAAGAGLYYILRSPVNVSKKVSILRLKDGGISELKIVIHVTNRTNKKFERLTITDKVPMHTDISPDHLIGTLKPKSIHSDGHKSVIKWELDNLEKHEERLLTYKTKSRLSVIGSITLPSVVLRFHTEKGTKMLTKSKKVAVKA